MAPDIAFGELAAERSDPDYRDTVLEQHPAAGAYPPSIRPSSEALEDAIGNWTRVDRAISDRTQSRHASYAGERCAVEYRAKDGSIAGAQARFSISDIADTTTGFAVNPVSTSSEGQHNARPDIVLFGTASLG